MFLRKVVSGSESLFLSALPPRSICLFRLSALFHASTETLFLDSFMRTRGKDEREEEFVASVFLVRNVIVLVRRILVRKVIIDRKEVGGNGNKKKEEFVELSQL